MSLDANIAKYNSRKKEMIVCLLDKLCQQLDITESQYQIAKDRYEAISKWLADSSVQSLYDSKIYPQGSIALGTAIKPIGGNEFDVDLVCYLPSINIRTNPNEVKKLIGSRLKEHSTYSGMLEEKQRCWRINYANEFHLDITPSIRNPKCEQGGELVPDKKLSEWKPTNPKGYIEKFELYSKMTPYFYLIDKINSNLRSDISPLPDYTMSKPLLKRIIQLLKRHRDHMFTEDDKIGLAPISVIITTLASWSYEYCISKKTSINTFDLIVDVIREMPNFITTEIRDGKEYFIIKNETTSGENFADKWNEDPRLKVSFINWQRDALESVESMLKTEGLDRFADRLTKKFGAQKDLVHETIKSINNPINEARSNGKLIVAPNLGLSNQHVLGSVIVPKNTFFGR